MAWIADFFPPCAYHVFLSHSREDHDGLVRPVYDRLRALEIASWIDRHHYPFGADSRTALQNSLLECRHTVFFLTRSMLASPRGWCVLELAYSELLQRSLTVPAGPLSNTFLPLFFVSQADPVLPRTVWQATRDCGVFHDPEGGLDAVTWAVAEIRTFLIREARTAKQNATRAKKDVTFRESLRAPTGLRERVCRFDPQAVPEA